MERCETCGHWDNTPTWAAEMPAGYCERLSTLLYVEGRQDSGYAIDTLPDFGCILHVPKEADNGTS